MKYFKSFLISSLLFLFIFNTYAQTSVNPYNPEPKMELLKAEKGENPTMIHFLVFGDAKGSDKLSGVLELADSLQPDFCITTGDLVDKGGGEKGKSDYKELDKRMGWFMRKYPVWAVMGNHERSGGDDAMENFTKFFGISETMHSFEYGNTKFISLPYPEINEDSAKLNWLEKELSETKVAHIFIYKHRPDYTVGAKFRNNVLGEETKTTRLFDKYNVTAVFSSHDHIYYRTKRNTTNYIISSGAGSSNYQLSRENESIKGDTYFGKRTYEELNNGDFGKYKFVDFDGTTTDLTDPIYYLVSIKVGDDKVTIEMIDQKNGKVWDKADIK